MTRKFKQDSGTYMVTYEDGSHFLTLSCGCQFHYLDNGDESWETCDYHSVKWAKHMSSGEYEEKDVIE